MIPKGKKRGCFKLFWYVRGHLLKSMKKVVVIRFFFRGSGYGQGKVRQPLIFGISQRSTSDAVFFMSISGTFG